MKCQKCNHNEANFFYSSSVNGVVTETRLCSECASGAGYDIINVFDVSSMFEQFMPVFGRPMFPSGLMPRFAPPSAALYPQLAMARNDVPVSKNSECGCGNGAANQCAGKTEEFDDKMTQRRELNMQLRDAVEKEEFEKAAQLRDKIKELGQ